MDSGDLLFKKYKNPISEKDKDIEIKKAKLMVLCFNQMGLDAMAVGDDDLSLGKEFLIEISKQAKFPFISSNILDEDTEKPLFQPYIFKEIDGIRIGILALISEHLFLNPNDPRKKGLKIGSPSEIAQKIVNEIKSKVDLIILLSHLSYPKDIELVQSVKGINIIFGSHLGMNLSTPPIIDNTIILQSAPRGMYGAMINFILNNNQPFFYNIATKREFERRLNLIKQKLNEPQLSEAEKTQLIKTKNEYEKIIKGFAEKNGFSVSIQPLHNQIKEDEEIKRLIDDYKEKIQIIKGVNNQPN